MNTHKLFNTFLVIVLMAMAVGMPMTVSAQSDDLHFNVARSGNFLHLYGWPIGSTLTISFDDPANGPGDDFQITDIAVSEFAFSVFFDGEFDVDAGHLVTVSDGTTSMTHIVKNLSITSANPVTNIVSGIAEVGTSVWVGSHGDPLTAQVVDPDPNGYWEADFSSDGLQPGYGVTAHQYDEYGNSTQWDFGVPEHPTITVSLHQNAVIYGGEYPNGERWPENAVLTLSIDDPSNGPGEDYNTQVVPGQEEIIWGNPAFILYDQFQIQPGQIVTVSGGGYEVSHVVQDLQITNMDIENDIIYGKCSPYASVVVGIFWYGQRRVSADSNGNWSIDTSGQFPTQQFTHDLSPQSEIDISCTDPEYPFLTTYKFHPTFLMVSVHGDVQGQNWIVGQPVILEIDDPSTPDSPDFSGQAWPYPGWYGTVVEFPVLEALDIQPGFIITATHGDLIKTHVVTDLTITTVDIEDDTVSGTAAPYAYVTVNVGDIGVRRTIQADGAGYWIADFKIPTTEFSIWGLVFDITIENHISVSEYDEDGDSTWSTRGVLLPVQIPLGTSLTTPSRGTVTSGTPTVYWIDPLTVSTTGRSGGTGTATLTMNEGYVQTITLDEIPLTSGTYMGTFAAPYPHYGTASISFTIHYPDGDDQQGSFTLYIDPSGVVRDTFGNPVVGATVTLYRSVDPGGPFVALSDGSAIMSLGNRTNPDLTGADGLFGWDVVVGYYKVRAEKAGCSAPGGGAFVETGVLTIPPPVTDLELILKCQEPPSASAGGPYTVVWGAMLTLDGSGSTDPESNIASYEWDLDNDGEYDDATGITITTSFIQLGDHLIGLRVTDDSGLSDTDTATVTVLPWTLKGFYQPVDMNGVYNIVKKGSTVPLKFEIFVGNTELTDVANIESLTYAQTSCDATATTDDIETTATGGTSLRYDAASGQFIYYWKAPKLPGKCLRVTMVTQDGSSLVAYFKLK